MLKGSFVALITPFLEDGSTNYQKLKELVEYHINNGTNGLVVLGTTAEAATIDFEEQKKIVKFVIELVNKRIPVMVGAGSNSTEIACKNAYELSRLGADYILSITPYYNKCNNEGMIRHFEAIAKASACPVMLYNVPGRTNVSISIEAIAHLAKNKNICGIKEASGNMSYAMKVSQYLSDDFVMFSGNDDIILPMISIGASGVISVLANICPKTVKNICQYALDGNYLEARMLANSSLKLANALFMETSPIPIKEAMNYLGFEVGGYHLPLCNMSFENKEKLIKVINESKGVINL